MDSVSKHHDQNMAGNYQDPPLPTMCRFRRLGCSIALFVCGLYLALVITWNSSSQVKQHENNSDLFTKPGTGSWNSSSTVKEPETKNVLTQSGTDSWNSSSVVKEQVTQAVLISQSRSGSWNSSSVVKERKTKVVLFTQSRSGSSFIGKILEQRPNTFYSFEPLRFISFSEESNFITHDKRLESNISEVINNLLHCNFHHIEDLSKRYYPYKNKARQKWLPTAFPGHQSFNGATSQCTMKENIAIKIIRVKYLKYLIPSLTEKGVTLIQLVRDPRGRLSSWLKLKLTDNGNKDKVDEEDLYNPHLEETVRNGSMVYCQILEENFKYTQYLVRANIIDYDNFITIRYEDFSYHPQEMAEKLMNYLGEEPTPQLFNWLYNITHTKGNNSYIPWRISSEVVEAWREFLPFHLLNIIQEQCSFVIKLFGYKLVESEEMYRQYKKNGSLVDILPTDISQL